MASTYTRKLIYCLQEAHFTLSLVMTVAHEYYATFYTEQHVLARVCQSVDTSQFFKGMYSRSETCLPLGRKQRSTRRRKVRPRSSKLLGKPLVRKLLLLWWLQPLLRRSLLSLSHTLHPWTLR